MPARRQLANAVRALAMDAVERAKSGHPGMPMGMADIAEVLWNGHLRHNPANPAWPDRDRFVVSNGHGSMLVYALLHLAGYDLPMVELENFRQLHSRTAGHPEFRLTPGVETTTGPLGQGLANAVGMAITERALAARFNRPGHDVVDHRTYVFTGDGCLMEGISHEACSLAGTLGLGKLIVFYDDNGISIDGEVGNWFTDDTPARFEAYGWQVVRDVDGHDPGAVDAAIAAAHADSDRPSLLCCRTTIGWGAPTKAGTASTHGAPLGADEVAGARAAMGWPHPPFEVPDDVRAGWDARTRGASLETDWRARMEAYRAAYPDPGAELERRFSGALPADWRSTSEAAIADIAREGAVVATRKASQIALEHFAPHLPELVGGSADLTGSNLTEWSGSRPIARDAPDGNYIFYGVREFAMCAIANGMALHGGVIPYAGTFLVFSDYARNAIRMAALMELRGVFVLTHDSIGLGEDGPTHQAVEHAPSLRLVPNLSVWRPCDTVETAAAWRYAIERDGGPVCLLLSRQGVPHQERTTEQVEAIPRGGYVLVPEPAGREPDAVIIATGSEVGLAVEAAATLAGEGHAVRVVSMPSTDVFDAQDEAYRDEVLPAAGLRVAVEASHPDGWRKYVGLDGLCVGVSTFGESAPAADVYRHFGLVAETVAGRIRARFAAPNSRAAGSGA
ncbi:MAG: transketolase [Immundisolibacterales bacterium]|nr:transketolase [Immundisolibacterales bacterium]